MGKYEDALALLRRERDDELKRAAAATWMRKRTGADGLRPGP